MTATNVSVMARLTAPVAVAAVLAASLLPVDAAAQSVRDQFRAAAKADNIGRAFQTFNVFSGTPGISTAKYYSDVDLNSYKLPLSHSFAPLGWQGPLGNVSPYVELTLGYLDANQNGVVDTPFGSGVAKLNFNSFTGLAGAGLDIPLSDTLRLRPILLGGYTQLTGGAHYNGPGQGFFFDVTHGIITDVHINSAILGGAMELIYNRTIWTDVRLRARVRYNQLVTIVTDASDTSLDDTGNFGVATGGAELNGPTGMKLFGRDLRWLGFIHATWLLNTPKSVLGFNSFVELGGGVQFVDNETIPGIQGLILRASAIVGPGVDGWSVGLSLAF